MGFIRTYPAGFSVEQRRESFVVHPRYGYDETGNEHSDELGVFGQIWREKGHPEFLLDDLDHLIGALTQFREDIS